MIDWSFVAAELARLAAPALPGRLLSVSVPVARWPETRWLEASVAWQRPDQGLRIEGCGMAFVASSSGAGRFAALHAAHQGLLQSWQYNDRDAPVAFSGFAFAPEGGVPLPNARLWVPELLLRAEQDRVTLTLSTPAEHASRALRRWQEAWHAWIQPSEAKAPRFSARKTPLVDQAFLARGRAALRAIAAGRFGKVVLTRSVDLTADAPIDPLPLLATLAARYPNCALFGVGFGPRAFVGASPEALLSLQGTQVRVDALAGTAWKTALRPLDDDKNRREYEFVVRAVTAGLAACCRDIARPAAPEVMHLSGLTHLRCSVSAHRDAAVSPFDLIAHLHPTPAVGGAPTPAALDWLHAHNDPRGAWYTGGIGWLDTQGDADIAVALRCGLIEADTIRLYAGAGFVAGSDPEQELAETETKLEAMRCALMDCTTRARVAA